MISAHKIQERLVAYSQIYSEIPSGRTENTELEVLQDQSNYINKTSEYLEASAKFDLGEISVDDGQALVDTGRVCAEEGLFSLPFEKTYIEITLVDNTSKNRTALLFGPASQFFDKIILERRPEFIGGTAALNFVRKGEVGPAQGSWEVPALVAVFNKEFTKTYIVPAAMEFANYAEFTEDQYDSVVHFNTIMIYIMHSLLNARGVELKTELPPIKLNRKRVQKNRPPLYEHHVLKIGGYSSSGRVLGLGASHASPRSHWRRGHVRTIHRATPQEKRIAIPACLINGPGFISKDYEISR
jgi:hypothetical protein